MNSPFHLLIWLAAFSAYFTPAIIAWVRRVPRPGWVIVVNVFAGWTVVGWVAALAMACRSKQEPEPVTR